MGEKLGKKKVRGAPRPPLFRVGDELYKVRAGEPGKSRPVMIHLLACSYLARAAGGEDEREGAALPCIGTCTCTSAAPLCLPPAPPARCPLPAARCARLQICSFDVHPPSHPVGRDVAFTDSRPPTTYSPVSIRGTMTEYIRNRL